MTPERYENLITSQHRGAPKFVAWVRFLVSLLQPEAGEEMIAAYTLSGAQGAQLDTLGELSGIGRDVLGEGTSLEDGLYRRLVRAKIVKNQFKGQQGELSSIWETVFGSDLGIRVHDNQDMTMGVELTGSDYSPEMMGLLLGGYIVPKPLGVGIGYRLTTEFPGMELYPGGFISAEGTLEIPSGDERNMFHVEMKSGAVLSAHGAVEITSAEE